MREPYETLLGHYRGHPLLGPYVEGYEPDFVGLTDEHLLLQISSSEYVMVHVALAFWNGDTTAKVRDLAALDETHLRRVVDALEYHMAAFR
jgi:hypothetical protein